MRRRAQIRRPGPITTGGAGHPGSLGFLACTLVALTLAGCTAAPPLKMYTLSPSTAGGAEAMTSADPPPPPGAPVIEVTRVRLPTYVDSRDLVVRQGDLLERSSTGRWASRLSIAATDLLTARLALRWPDAWVTDQAQARPPDYRLMVDISRLDITNTGKGTLEADWAIVPRNASARVVRERTQFTMSGQVGTDESVAGFVRKLLERLSSEIDLSSLHSPGG